MLSIEDIVKLVRNKQVEFEGKELDEKQIAQFVDEIQSWIRQMDFTLPEGTTIVAYSGGANGKDYAWEVAREISTIAGDEAVYIRDTPPGELLNDVRFIDALETMLGEDAFQSVCNGYDSSGKRIPEGGCGFGEGIQSLADYISGQFMKRATGTSGNIVVLVPKGVAEDKVFAVTELKQIFENSHFKTINGISKEQLKSIYNSGEVGKNAVYSILQETSQRAIMDTEGVADQAKSLYQAIGKHGILNGNTNSFSILSCYDESGTLIGIQLDMEGKGTIIPPPANTAYQTPTAHEIGYATEAELIERFGEERYRNYTDLEKKQVAELDYMLRNATEIDMDSIPADKLKSYLKSAGKTVDQLDDKDKAILGLSYTMEADPQSVKGILGFVNKHDSLIKMGTNVAGAVDIICTVVYAGMTIYESYEAYQEGNTDKAIGKVTGMAAELTVSSVDGSFSTGSRNSGNVLTQSCGRFCLCICGRFCRLGIRKEFQ